MEVLPEQAVPAVTSLLSPLRKGEESLDLRGAAEVW